MKEYKKLFKWSQKEFANLPWRVERTLYTTLVSEIMLQQTTVGTVLNHYDRFLKQYPDIKKLAKATEEEIQVAWKGLGYYRRARNLLKAAKFIVHKYKGDIPLEYEQLVSIPGIGDYTASAIMAIGANQKALAIDANLDRVISRLYDLKVENLKGNKRINLIKDTIENGTIELKRFKDFRLLNEALMDLGRVYCKARIANCMICPMNDSCQSLKKGKVEQLIESKEKKIKKTYELDLARFLIKKNKKILVVKKNKGEWLQGQFELPTFILRTEDKKLSQYPEFPKKDGAKHLNEKNILILQKSTITKYKINNQTYTLTYKAWDHSNLEKVVGAKGNMLEWVDEGDPRIGNTCTKIINKIKEN